MVARTCFSATLHVQHGVLFRTVLWQVVSMFATLLSKLQGKIWYNIMNTTIAWICNFICKGWYSGKEGGWGIILS